MKTIFLGIALAVFSTGFTSCSKCYDCVEIQEILDSNGNVIDHSEVHEEVCTIDNAEIERREADGATCSH